MERTIIGYQIANEQGENIQGDDEVNTFASFEVLALEVAHAELQRLLSQHRTRKYLLQPIFEGDIEEYTLVSAKE